MTITSVVLRRRVADLGPALDFYVRLTGQPATRFTLAGLDLASVGPFLLFSGPDGIAEGFAGVAASLTVADLDAAVTACAAAGGEVIDAPAVTPNGKRAVVRHPDGAVYEYLGG
ncbi:VOC family protein [Streptomyces sp. NPDC051567]|uniref:VOC family protein n=1 Tax=Streptomyces sp. NPDC051567 TaxID=3365660 RepID=UPI0037B79682